MTTPSPPASLPTDTRIGRTALRVADRDELTDFYRRVVGLSVLDRGETTTTLGVDGTPLLVLEAAPDAQPRDRTEAGLYHTAFRVPSRGALGDALQRVREHWHLDGASDHGVSEALYLTDPENNGVEIYHDRPRAEWPVDDGALRMVTDPLDRDAVAAAATGETDAPDGTDVGHVHLEVSSLDAFRAFYVETLGFEVQQRMPSAWFVSAGGYHHHVGANTWHGRTTPRRGRGLAWFEVVVTDADALDAVRERVADGEGTVTGTDDGFAVTDPDGIEVRFRAAGTDPR